MKRLIIFLCLMMFGVANADFLGVKQPSETISFFIKEPIDSAYGIPRLPDSVHIFTYADNATTATFATRSTTYPFSDVSIDTLKRYGDTTYVFADQIQDIDGIGGNYELAILVKMFTNGYYLETHNTVQIVSDSLENFLDASKDSSTSAAVLSKNNLDSLQATLGVDVVEITADATSAANLKEAFDGDATPEGYITKLSELDEDNTTIDLDGTTVGTVTSITNPVVADDTMSTGDSLGTKENQTSILAYFDTLIYVGPRGLGVYLDSAAANTNTVLGTDGTSKNPVSTIAAAKTIATALGYNRYYFINASTFNDAANDLASSHQNWEFIGIGNNNALAFGTQRVDESRFENMDLSGTMHASGGDVLYTNCSFGYITANFNGHAFNCWLEDTIVVKADQDIDFARCQSGVAGNRTPTIDLSGGASVVQLRGYSGGIRIMNGASTDTMSIETDGQVIISANNTSINITVRGMLTLTDSGTTTNLTKDAVFSRAEADLWIWANADTAQPDSSELGVWLVNNLVGAAGALDSTILSNILHRIVWGTAVGSGSDSSTAAQRDIGAILASVITSLVDDVWDEDSTGHWTSPNMAFIAGQTSASALDSTIISNILHRIVWGTPVGSGSDSSTVAQRDIGAVIDRILSLAKFDTSAVAVFYDFGIWLDGAAANTNTTVGVDGTRANPVSTLAAARTLADSMGLQAYYLTNSSSFTLAATHEDWEFIGIGEGSLIDFGSQDVDGSVFEHLMISGTQGGTGVAGLHECYLNTIDSLEAIVIASSFSDTISVRVSGNTVFDQCYSNVAGNNTPGLDFNSAGTINVSVRHYSGGLALFNGTSTHTISYESDGQLVIDASCTSINISARGNMTITDNGTTTNLTDEATPPSNWSSMTVSGAGYVNINFDGINGTLDLNEIKSTVYGKIADTTRELLLNTLLSPGWPTAGDTVSALLLRIGTILSYTDGSDQQGVDTHVEYVEADLNRIVPFVVPHLAYVDDAAPTSSQFVVSSTIASYGDDFFNDLYLTFITGNLKGRTKRIIDFETTNDTIFTISFFSAPADKDSFVVSPGNFDLARDSLFYQGAAAGLTAAGVWQYHIRDDTTDGAVDDTSAADHLYSASVGSGGGIGDTTIARIDSISTTVGYSAVSISDRLGLFGTDDRGSTDSTAHVEILKIAEAVAAAGAGTGEFACSLLVYNGSAFISPARVRIVSGVQEFRVNVSADGWAVFALDGGTWTALVTALRYVQDTIPQTFTFSADYKDTLTMTTFSPSTPTDTGKVMLYVWTDSTFGATYVGATFRVIPLDKGKNWVSGGGRVIPLGELTKTTDSTGYAEIEVYQSSFTHPYPSGSDSLKYNISVTFPGLSSWSQFRFAAPDTGNQYQIGVIE